MTKRLPEPSASLRPSLPLVRVGSRAAWRHWLAANHETSAGVWAVTRKKAALRDGDAFVSARDLSEECLCFGWIDSRPAKIDTEHSALLCTPRKPASGWSKLNKDRVRDLLSRDLMAPAGLAAIERAKENGAWSRLDAISALEVPGDLAMALKRLPGAAAHFDAFPPSVRRGILEWIGLAKTDATRSKRVAETARLAQENKRANQWPRQA